MAYYKNTRAYKRRNKNKKSKVSSVDETVVLANKTLNERLDSNEKQEAMGVAIHSVVNRRTSSTFLTDVNDYKDTTLDDRLKVVDLSRRLRTREGVCSTVADLLIDFGITRGSYYSDNPELKEILNKWADFVNKFTEVNNKTVLLPVPGLRALFRKLFDDYLTDGDAFFTLFWKQGVKMSEATDEESLFLPISIREIDSLAVTVDPELAQLGIDRVVLKLSDPIKDKLTNPQTDADKLLQKSVPKEWLKFLKNDEDIVLDPSVTYHIKRNAKDYKPYGEPLFLKAFSAIANKRRLQAVDEATITGLINRFTIFSLGLPDKEKNPGYHNPKPARVQALIDILTNPKRANAMVWPGPDLNVQDIGPDGKVLEFTDKYKQYDLDILRSLHVSPLLIDGGSSGQAVRDWAAFLSTEVGLDAMRDELEKIFTNIGKDIAFANNIDFEKVSYRFGTNMLKDETKIRNVALKVYELGGISTETFVNTLGYDFDKEKDLKTKETKEGLHEIFINRAIPFQGKPDEEGRPEDTTDNDLAKPSSNRNEEDTTSSAKLGFVEDFYIKLYNSAFEKIKNDIRRKIEVNIDDIKVIELSLISGFLMFKILVEAQIKEVFFRTLGGRITSGFDDELKFLLEWNSGYIDSFFVDLRSGLELIKNDADKFTELIDRQSYRIQLYATESVRKAEFLGRVALAEELGIKEGQWITTIDNKTCPVCVDRHKKKFKLSKLMNVFPAHPNCRCQILIDNIN